jgi:uncharacterized protein YutE (UPF0331/DUF86 family)
MQTEFNGIEKRLDELSERLARLEPLKSKPRIDFDQDAYLRDIAERNLEISIQCCIDICNRIISLENARKPADYYEAILLIGELGIIPPSFARKIAPMAGFRNILVHEYLVLDWGEVYNNLQQISDLEQFAQLIRNWLQLKKS